MSSQATGSAPEAPSPEPAARRRRTPVVLIGIASLLAFLAIFALWANRQLLDTENWTDTSSELLENDAIRGQTAVFLVDQLYANVDVQGQLEEALPPRAQPLAGPAAGGLKDLAVRGADTLLGRPRPQVLWEEANRRAHDRLMDVIEGGGEVVSTEGGDVTLDLKSLLGQTADRVGVGERAEARIPEDAAQITIMESDSLELAQDAVRFLRAAAVVLVVLALGLLVLAVYLATGWRRKALRAAGFGLLLAGAAALVARSFAGDAVVDALASTAAVRPAAEAAWSISTSLLVEVASATIAYGVVLVGAAWLAGTTAWATATRRTLAPYLREPRLAYGALSVIVLALLAWGPTPAMRRVVPALVLVALLARGVEMLRRQTAREFPDETRKESRDRVRERVGRMGGWVRGGGARTANGRGNGAIAPDRLEQLERLGRLRDSGVLDAREFEREKAEILGPAPVPTGGPV
jgi:Short C-terminal domain